MTEHKSYGLAKYIHVVTILREQIRYQRSLMDHFPVNRDYAYHYRDLKARMDFTLRRAELDLEPHELSEVFLLSGGDL